MIEISPCPTATITLQAGKNALAEGVRDDFHDVVRCTVVKVGTALVTAIKARLPIRRHGGEGECVCGGVLMWVFAGCVCKYGEKHNTRNF